ncbi:hypothetical protein CNX65_19750 [Actinosynnema pretiosum]|uniref:Anti-sigma factor antagonist n=3 Tax=Actinosynnema TaxID=40566 RepID=A0A290Z895_9PSEU|nr:hypothetical protein CNX65_19750 [Actinosynnema pretiosum]
MEQGSELVLAGQRGLDPGASDVRMSSVRRGGRMSAQDEQPVIVHASGDVDAVSAPGFERQLRTAFTEAADKGGPVVVDLTEVRFFASVGMSLLVEHHRLGARQGTPLRVVAPARAMVRAMRATTLDQLLDLYPTVQEAVVPESL